YSVINRNLLPTNARTIRFPPPPQLGLPVILLKTKHLDEILDPKRADAILAKGPLGGWLDKKTLDKVLNGDLPQKKDVFQGWRADKRTGRTVNLLIKSDPAIEKKYRFVYKMYAAYLKKTYREENLAKLAGNK
ncbi:hypothetical protein PC129_g23871, partial [Phytophthora cactorum]